MYCTLFVFRFLQLQNFILTKAILTKIMNNIRTRNVPDMQETSSSTTPFRKTLRLDNWFSVRKHKEPKDSEIKIGKQKFVANSEEGINAIHNAAKLLKTSKARDRSSHILSLMKII